MQKFRWLSYLPLIISCPEVCPSAFWRRVPSQSVIFYYTIQVGLPFLNDHCQFLFPFFRHQAMPDGIFNKRAVIASVADSCWVFHLLHPVWWIHNWTPGWNVGLPVPHTSLAFQWSGIMAAGYGASCQSILRISLKPCWRYRALLRDYVQVCISQPSSVNWK